MRFVLPTTYARTRIYRPRQEAVTREAFVHADVTDIHVRADDGVKLNGWYALSRADCCGPRPLILYCPGASGHRGYRVNEVEMFTRLGCDLLLVDYREYGDNAGRPTERLQACDARSVWRFARDSVHVPAERIVVFGESIGGGVAVRLAADLCSQGTVLGGLILQATFPCMVDVVSQFFPRVLSWIFLVDRFPSIRRIRHVTCPILAIHGDQDRLIPIAMGRRLFDAAPAVSANGIPKRFLQLTGVDHNDILEEAGETVEMAIGRFLQQIVPAGAIDQTPAPPKPGVMQPL